MLRRIITSQAHLPGQDVGPGYQRFRCLHTNQVRPISSKQLNGRGRLIVG